MNWWRSILPILTALCMLLAAGPALATPSARPQLPPLPEIPIVDGKRVALVIGNSNYVETAGWKKLGNAERDARYIADQLSNLSDSNARFEVMLLIDQNHEQMLAGLKEFAARAKSADVALVYYAGHGFQFKSENYLVPVDARPEVSERLIDREHIKFSSVVDAATAKKLTLFFLDACRTTDAITPTNEIDNNVNQAAYFGSFEAEGSGVIYAAGGGQPAYDAAPADAPTSPFAQAVINYLRFPGLELSDFYKFVARDVRQATASLRPTQFPLVTARMDTRFYFLPPLSEQPRRTVRVVTLNDANGNPVQVELPEDDLLPEAAMADGSGGGGPVDPLPRDVGALPTLTPLDIPLEVLTWADDEILVIDVIEQRSLKQLGVLSSQGDPLADYILGIMYFDGIMVEADWDKAWDHFEKSAETGHPAGLYGLAWFAEQLIFVHNVAIEPDQIPDLETLYRASHEAGFDRATVRLAEAYADGLIAPPDDKPNDIIDMWRQAAELGHARSMYMLINRGDEKADFYIEQLHMQMEGEGDLDSAIWMCQLGDEHIDVRMQIAVCLSVASGGEPMALAKLTTDLMRRDGAEFTRAEIQNWATIALQLAELSLEDKRYLQQIVDGKF